MLVKVLGAAKEVGRSGFLIKDGGSILLDYGVLLHRNPDFPLHVRPKDIDGVIVTHAHLDHVGMVPVFFLRKGVPVYMTPITYKLSKLLLYDMIKISGSSLPFGPEEVEAMDEMFHPLAYNERTKMGEFEVELLNAGHIPGSSMVYLRDTKSVLYTGDMNHVPTQLTNPAEDDLPEVDLIITESTYATSDHPDRNGEERRLIDFANEVVERGGTMLIPSFSVGRAQEVAMIFYKYDFKHKVYMDGMALKANEILLESPEFLRDATSLEKALNRIEFIERWSQRRRAVKEPAVIISPAGMLVGGASVFYNLKIAKSEKNGIAIVSFQVPGTPGRDLLDKRSVYINGEKVEVKAEVRRFDLSSHSGRKELIAMFKEKVKGSPKVLVVHGDKDNCEAFAKELREMGFPALAPNMGDEIEV